MRDFKFPRQLLAALIEESLNGEITDERRDRLNEILQEHPRALDYYIGIMRLHLTLQDPDGVFELRGRGQHGDPEFDLNLWHALAEQEVCAAAVTVDDQNDKLSCNCPAVLRQTNSQPNKREISKFAVYLLTFSAAAVLFFVMGIFINETRMKEEVATLVDSIGAEWGEGSAKTGDRLCALDGNLVLRKGYAEVLFDNNAKLVLEGPIELKILALDQVELKVGKLYSYVPPEACGFTVSTGNAKVMDLGTEFGVEVASSGTTELHVLDGKTVLVAGEGKLKSSQEITKSEARVIDSVTGSVYQTTCSDRLFARDIDSKNEIVWRGEDISLADVVSGGFAEGTGKIGFGIDTRGGEFKQFRFTQDPSIDWDFFSHVSDGEYHEVEELPFVDGVFAPYPARKQVRISSTGLVYDNCPDTNGKFYVGIRRANWRGNYELPSKCMRRPMAALSLHPNQGITFDLKAFRDFCKDRNKEIVRFYGIYGISPESLEVSPDLVSSVHVLVDGEVRFEKIDYKPGEPGVLLNVPISPEDRFLTLITTDGSDDMTANNWAVIADPLLIFDD